MDSKLSTFDSASYYTRAQKLYTLKVLAADGSLEILSDKELSRVFNIVSRAIVKDSGEEKMPEGTGFKKTLIKRNKKNV